MDFTPPVKESALKFIEEFESGPKLSDVRLKSTARMSGAFPLPSEFQSANPLGGFLMSKRPFDDSILNQNDSLLKKRRSEKRSNDDVNSSLNDSIVLASPWEMRKMKGELIQARAEITALEARCNQLHNLRKGDFVLFEQEKKSLKQTADNNKQTIADLEAKLKKMRKREQQLKEDLDGTNEQKMRDLHILEEKNNSLIQENSNLKTKISELELKAGEVNRELSSNKTELGALRDEIKLTGEQLSKLQTQLTEYKVQARQHELDKASLIIAQRKISELESDAKNYSETAALLKDQQTKLIRMSELERQLSLLKSENINFREAQNKILKLNEVVHDLKAQLKDMEELESHLKSTKVDLGLAVNELNEFRTLSRGVVGEGSGHTELSSYVREMQQARLLAHMDLATLQAKLKTAEDTNQNLTASSNKLQGDITKLKNDQELYTNTVRRLKKQHAIITWERDDLRKMLDSLQKETTMTCVDSKVEALERLVDGYRKRVDQMEQETGGTLSTLSPTLPDHSSTLESLRKKNAELMQKNEKLEYELEHRNLKGDFDTRNSKILHLKMNPADEAINTREDKLEKAQSEVALLREKLRVLQEALNTSQIVNVSQIAMDKVQEIHSKELDDLREKVKSQELQKQRILEAFKASSGEFREAIHSLLGYHISSVQNKKLFKLTSMYADSPDLHLLFQMQPEGGMELLETDLSKSVVDLIDEHLRGNHSIPMFLSALTMQLFNMHSQSTIVG